ncbi:MAG: amidophosphoribosyltransferase [Ardenticatenales bacterium]|nr:amidophosphoribosyltransferase [Ardenticatenales bacterium]
MFDWQLEWQDDKAHDECGIVGVFAPGRDVARLAFFGLYALQHRGQESAGICTTDSRTAYIHKGMGLVAQVFKEDNLAPLVGHLAIGHNRYSTTGSSHISNAQPYLIETIHGPLGVAHNGNLTNALHLRYQLLKRGVGLSSTSDSEVITQMLAAPADVWTELPAHGRHTDHWLARLHALQLVAEGAYSLVVLTRRALYAMRDPLGLRPLCLGALDGGGYVVASESCALHTIGARFLREIQPGEIVRIDETGITSYMVEQAARPALCIFEYVYFARPDSTFEGQVIHEVRQRLGRRLAQEAPAPADVVIGVPDSSTPAAIGYSLESGIPFSEGLTKNRYIGRTFIQPDDHLRKEGIRIKYNPLSTNLRGKRVVMVDDSIVRGNTAGPLVQLLRDGGAREVHVRVSSPPVRFPCFMGIDMATQSQLIAHRLDVEGIRRRVGADSLAYLSLEGMVAAVNAGISPPTNHCHACFSGQYPLDIPDWLFHEEREKMLFEGLRGVVG